MWGMIGDSRFIGAPAGNCLAAGKRGKRNQMAKLVAQPNWSA
jgi:hypothetical protein